jgi:hypothetical protein
MNLQDLPTEILTQCFKHLCVGWYTSKELKALRLTSKRLEAISTPLLIDFVSVYIAADSMSRLEAISRHPVFSKSIRTVQINISFYDALLANDFTLFAKCCTSKLLNSAESFDRLLWKDGDEEIKLASQNAWRTYNEWSAFIDGEYDEDDPTTGQVLLQKAHREYRRRFDDQESVKRNNEHLGRIGAALQQLEGLHTLVLDDCDYRRSIREWISEFSDEGLMEGCLTATPWKGARYHTETASPPVELIPDIFSTLLRFSIFPAKLGVCITPPNDLAALQMPEEKLNCITRVLHRAKELSFIVRSWSRQDSLAVDNSRPLNEILHLGNLTCAFFDVATLQHLCLMFEGYPVFYETPQISMSQILPLTRTWSQLHTLELSHIPFHPGEAVTLAARHRMVIKRLDMFEMYLLSGRWVDTIEIFRSFEKLEQVKWRYPRGGEFGRGGYSVRCPEGAVEEYILRKAEKNPLTELEAEGHLLA